MHHGYPKNTAIPGEYRSIAEALFPPDGFSNVALPAVVAFAETLGIGADYQRLLGVKKDTTEMREFLGHFQNNLDLLIQKTWVEKVDEMRRVKLQDDVTPFMNLIVRGNFQQAVESFGAILEELAYLFFGAQSSNDDFTEYTLRIDIQMGLFWWYGARLAGLNKTVKQDLPDDDTLWAILLVGICYLTNF